MVIGVVMPAYDEERHIGAVLDGLPTRFEDHDIPLREELEAGTYRDPRLPE